MRKLVTWVLVSLGIAALVRKLRRRSEARLPQTDVPDVAAATAGVSERGVSEGGIQASEAGQVEEDPADELRRKLADARDEETQGPSSEDAPESTIEERRGEVHEQGRAAIDDMQRSTED